MPFAVLGEKLATFPNTNSTKTELHAHLLGKPLAHPAGAVEFDTCSQKSSFVADFITSAAASVSCSSSAGLINGGLPVSLKKFSVPVGLDVMHASL